jgi:hypothetical protein
MESGDLFARSAPDAGIWHVAERLALEKRQAMGGGRHFD